MEATALTPKQMAYYAVVEPPGVLHVVRREPPKDQPIGDLCNRHSLRKDYLLGALGFKAGKERDDHKGWCSLQNVSWLRHVDTGERVPIVGPLTEFLKTPRAKRDDMNFDYRSFAQFMQSEEGEKFNGNGDRESKTMP